MPSAWERSRVSTAVAVLFPLLVCFFPLHADSRSFRVLERSNSLNDKLLRSQEASPAFSTGAKSISLNRPAARGKSGPAFNRDGKLTFPTNIRPLTEPTEDTAVPHFPGKDLPVFPPEQGPASLRITRRTPTSVTLAWEAPEGTLPTLYNLLMDRVSVYSGPNTYFTQTGINSERCYVFQVSAYVDGRWTKFSSPRHTSSLEHAVSLEKIDNQVQTIKAEMEKAAMAQAQGNACLLEEVNNMGVVHTDSASGGGSIEFDGELSAFSSSGVEASVLNCQVANCMGQSGMTTTLVKSRTGHLNIRQDDGTWKLRFLSIPENTNIIEFNNPNNAFIKTTINLIGCRANELDEAASVNIGKVGVGAKKCMQLNCTRESKMYFFCEPSKGPPVKGRFSIQSWMNDVNRATYPSKRFNRFEAGLKVTISPKLVVDTVSELDGEVDHRIYAAAGYREPFFFNFLTRLVKIDATPHFPQLLGTFRCSDLPKKFKDAPGPGGVSGILPAFPLTGNVAATVDRMKIDGDAFSSAYMGAILEPTTVDLETYINSFKGFALDNEWVRGIMFQLIHGLGVGHHAYGLHHNDLLTMSNIRLKQYPREAKGVRKYFCYQLNDVALSGNGCGGAEGNIGAEGGKGEEPKDIPKMKLTNSGSYRGEKGKGASFLEVHVSEFSGPPETSDLPSQSDAEKVMTSAQSIKHKCIAGVNGDPLEADQLPSTVCQTGSKAGGGSGSGSGSSSGGSGSGSRSDSGSDDGGEVRNSWCIPAETVDGMHIKIHGLGAAALTKKTVEYWKKGYIFPNAPWDDDLADVAVIMCGYIAPHMSKMDVRGRDLCKKMKLGEYQANPLAALRHPYFSDYLKKEQMPIVDRNNYIYMPGPACDCKSKKRLGVPKRHAQADTGRENAENGIADESKPESKPKMPTGQKSAGLPFLGAGRGAFRLKNMTMGAPTGSAPMTPWISKLVSANSDVSATVKWTPVTGSKYYNLLLDGVSAYSGPANEFKIDNLRESKCYRVTVAAFVKGKGWTPLSKALHINRCGLRSDA